MFVITAIIWVWLLGLVGAAITGWVDVAADRHHRAADSW